MGTRPWAGRTSRDKGAIHGNHGCVEPMLAFIKLGGAAVDGVVAVTPPVVVFYQSAMGNVVKPGGQPPS